MWVRLEVLWLVQHMPWEQLPSVLQVEGSVTGQGDLFSLLSECSSHVPVDDSDVV